MLVILEAVAGPVTGRRIEVKSGSILRVGRTARADYALAEDGYLSSLHFAVECDGSQARIRDLGSSNGTFVNGNRITDQVVREGDSLAAGGSTFTVHTEETPPPSPSDTGAFGKTAPNPLYATAPTRVFRSESEPVPSGVLRAWPGFTKSQANLLQHMYGPGTPVFAVLDASRDSRIPAFLDASGERYLPIDASGRSPVYVVPLAAQSRLLDVLIKDGWGRGWCSYFIGNTTIEIACAQMAAFVTLYTVHGQPLTFRFWDPRALRVLIPLMSVEEATLFFGPFQRMVVEAERPEIAVELSLTPYGPRLQTIML